MVPPTAVLCLPKASRPLFTPMFRTIASYHQAIIIQRGGAIWSSGGFAMRYSTVAENSASCASGDTGTSFGGGIYVRHGNSYMESSTISNNVSCNAFGGLITNDYTASTVITDSTISNNEAQGGRSGGVEAFTLSFSMSNSTVAFNSAAMTSGTSPGLTVISKTVTLNSNVLSNNVLGAGVPNDIVIVAAGEPTVSGSNNLIFAPNASLPADTIVGNCPLLRTLRDNGGPTRNHRIAKS